MTPDEEACPEDFPEDWPELPELFLDLAFTVTLHLYLTPFTFAVIVALPVLLAVIFPFLFTLTTDGALDDQVTLREVPLSFSCFDVLV